MVEAGSAKDVDKDCKGRSAQIESKETAGPMPWHATPGKPREGLYELFKRTAFR